MTENKQSELLSFKYAGSVCNNSYGSIFQYGVNKKKHCKHFSKIKFGSAEKAEIAAQYYQEKFSDDNGFTVVIFSADSNEPLRRYLIAFADGDGYILVTREGYVKVGVVQAQNSGIPPILLIFQSTYGGDIGKPTRHTGKKWRPTYVWYCHGFATLPILKDWMQFGVLKRDQAKSVFEFMTRNNTSNCLAIYSQLSIAKEPKNYLNVEIDDSVLTIYYLAGLFDAEGSISCSYGTEVQVKFAQQNSLKLLDSINNFCQDTGTVNDVCLRFTGKSAEPVLCEMLPYLIVKKEQAQIALELRKCVQPKSEQGKGRSEEMNNYLAKLREKLKALKQI